MLVVDESLSDSDPELDLMSIRDNNPNYLKALLNNFASQSLISSYDPNDILEGNEDGLAIDINMFYEEVEIEDELITKVEDFGRIQSGHFLQIP